MAAPTVEWLCQELTKLLGFEATEDIGNYILSIETAEDVEDYLGDLLGDKTIPKNKKFINEAKRRWRPPPKKIDLPDDVKVYRKQDTNETFLPSKPGKASKKTKGRKSGGASNNAAQNQATPQKSSESPKQTPRSKESKKQKFVPLFSKQGEAKTVAMLPGRHGCDCLATKHALINNCTSCGRIVCDQEGSGPCLFCGALVCTKDEEEVLARGSKKSEALRTQLMGGQMLSSQAEAYRKGLHRAMEHKNKLLEYDRTSAKRTQVIDDESDYFNADSNRWLSKAEKEKLAKRERELREKRYASRLDRKVTLDFAGHRVVHAIVDATEIVDMYNVNDDVIQEVYFGKGGGSEGGMQNGGEVTFSEDDFGALVNPTVKVQPQFVASNKKSFAEATTTAGGGGGGG